MWDWFLRLLLSKETSGGILWSPLKFYHLVNPELYENIGGLRKSFLMCETTDRDYRVICSLLIMMHFSFFLTHGFAFVFTASVFTSMSKSLSFQIASSEFVRLVTSNMMHFSFFFTQGFAFVSTASTFTSVSSILSFQIARCELVRVLAVIRWCRVDSRGGSISHQERDRVRVPCTSSSICTPPYTLRNMAMVNPINPSLSSPYNQLANVKDSRWLTLEVCREFQRNKCSRPETECKFAHPPPNVEVQNGRVTCCFDSIKVSHFHFRF